MDDFRQHLDTLGLGCAASLAEIKQAYRDLMMVWHPDRFSGNLRLQQLAEEKTKQINLAYQKLNSHWATHGAGLERTGRTDTNTAELNRQRESTSASGSSAHRREGRRQSRQASSNTDRARRSATNYSQISTTNGVLILLFACLSCCLFGFVEYAGFSRWKAVSIELVVVISLLSFVKAKWDHARLTIWNYLRAFATISLCGCLAIALLAVWLMKETNGRRSNT